MNTTIFTAALLLLKLFFTYAAEMTLNQKIQKNINVLNKSKPSTIEADFFISSKYKNIV